MRVPDTIRDLRLAAIKSYLEVSATPPYLCMYTNAYPGSMTAQSLGTELVKIDLSLPVGSISSHVLTLTNPPNKLLSNTGTVVWAALYGGDHTMVVDGVCTTIGDGGFVEVQSLSLTAGAILPAIQLRLSD